MKSAEPELVLVVYIWVPLHSCQSPPVSQSCHCIGFLFGFSADKRHPKKSLSIQECVTSEGE